jgi:hypothetical protein
VTCSSSHFGLQAILSKCSYRGFVPGRPLEASSSNARQFGIVVGSSCYVSVEVRIPMPRFADLVDHCTAFTLEALRQANERTLDGLQTSAATPLVKAIQMVQLQKAISAVGMFSLFEAMLQDGLECADGFREAEKILEGEGETVLKERFADFQLAINVLKHGRGRSYEALIAKADHLPFRIKRVGEAFFFEGDVSEVATLIEVDDAFVLGCAEVIRQVSETMQETRSRFFR